MSRYITQFFPGNPTFTEKDITDLKGKVFMVTGGNSGLGFELVKMLYCKGAKVYMASRTQSKAEAAIKLIKSEATSTPHPGQVKFIQLDLSDLATVKRSAEDFAAQEDHLDILWNNAGVGMVKDNALSKQGHGQQMGTNCYGPFLLTQLLTPKLQAAAKLAPKNSVRVIWTSSIIVDTSAPKGGVNTASLANPSTDQAYYYAVSKAGNWLLASEFARRYGNDGIVSVTQNPGQLRTSIWDGAPKVVRKIMGLVLYSALYGAYTALWCGISSEITVADGGRYAIPWGRWHPAPRKDILASLKSDEEGGTGEAAKFWDWCEEKTSKYA
ncbi:MAG: hypothetical protein ASARMPREDX12_003325 [Alectoria sarmentosa]|nr:MAG: hypothetical protein ASARMPREDX12_003325 [Alectoria sarmentosa]